MLVTFALTQGLCVHPWDTQSKSLAAIVYQTKEDAEREYKAIKSRQDKLDEKQDAALLYLHTLHINQSRLMERMRVPSDSVPKKEGTP